VSAQCYHVHRSTPDGQEHWRYQHSAPQLELHCEAGCITHVSAEALKTSLITTSQQTNIHSLHAVSTQAIEIAPHHINQDDHQDIVHDVTRTI